MATHLPSTVNDADTYSRPTLIAICWTLIGFTTVLYLARIYTRFRILRKPAIDDVVITLSVILNLIACALATVDIHYGLGTHVEDLSPSQLSSALKWNLIAQPFGIMAICVPKFAVAILIIRIVNPKKRAIWFLYFITTSLTILSALSAIFLFIQCSPPRAIWNMTIPHTCWQGNILTDFTIFVGAYSAFVDFALAAFVVNSLWSLQIKRKQKIGVCILMGLGVLAGICAIIKSTKLAALGSHMDYTWDVLYLFFWASIEINVTIICACVPTLRPLMMVLAGKRLARDSDPYSNDTRNSYSLKRTTQKGSKPGVSLSAREVDGSMKDDHSGCSEHTALTAASQRIKQTTEIEQHWETV